MSFDWTTLIGSISGSIVGGTITAVVSTHIFNLQNKKDERINKQNNEEMNYRLNKQIKVQDKRELNSKISEILVNLYAYKSFVERVLNVPNQIIYEIHVYQDLHEKFPSYGYIDVLRIINELKPQFIDRQKNINLAGATTFVLGIDNKKIKSLFKTIKRSYYRSILPYLDDVENESRFLLSSPPEEEGEKIKVEQFKRFIDDL